MTITTLTLPQIIAAIGGLGTASYGLVDSAKAIGGGPSNIGFHYIKQVIAKLYPESASGKGESDPLSRDSVLAILRADWLNGTSLAAQQAAAKALVKLRLNTANAPHLAQVTGVDSKLLVSVAEKMANGTKLEQPESDVLGRFDLVLTAILNEGYQRADQAYRNSAKLCAVLVSVVLALAGAAVLGVSDIQDAGAAILIGLLATPLAPVTKDLTSALQNSVKAMQLFRK